MNHPVRNTPRYSFAVIALILYILLGNFLFFWYMRCQVSDRMEESVNRILRLQEDSLDAFLDAQYETLSANAVLIGQVEEILCEDSLAILKAYRGHAWFDRLLLSDATGKGYASDGQPLDLSSQEYFQKAMAGEKVLSDPIPAADGSTQTIVLAVPIYNDSGDLSGMLGGSFDIARLTSLLFHNAYGDEGFCMILSPDAKVIAAGDIPADGNPFQVAANGQSISFPDGQWEQLQKDLKDGKSGTYLDRHDGAPYYACSTPFGYNDWLLFYVVPLQALLKEYRFIQNAEMVFLLFCLLGLTVFLLYMAYHVWLNNRQLSHRADTDALTGLLNKQAIEKSVNICLKSASPNALHLFCFLDLDGFKKVNDTLGHEFGDQVLKEVAQCLTHSCRNTDMVGRIGGDEFVLFYQNIGSGSHSIELQLQILCGKIANLPILQETSVKIGCSIGLAYSPDAGQDYATLYRNSDHAVYESKKKGKGCISIYH